MVVFEVEKPVLEFKALISKPLEEVSGIEAQELTIIGAELLELTSFTLKSLSEEAPGDMPAKMFGVIGGLRHVTDIALKTNSLLHELVVNQS